MTPSALKKKWVGNRVGGEREYSKFFTFHLFYPKLLKAIPFQNASNDFLRGKKHI